MVTADMGVVELIDDLLENEDIHDRQAQLCKILLQSVKIFFQIGIIFNGKLSVII